MEKQKITLLLPHLHPGGAERVAINLSNNFTQRGYAVDMVLLSAKGEFLTDLWPGICVVDLQVKSLRPVTSSAVGLCN